MISEPVTFTIAAAAEPVPGDQLPGPGADNPDLAFYRGHTLILLRRYFRLSLETGRLPSLLGREVFRARVSHYRMRSFEDAVIFVHDVERCLEQLDFFSQELSARRVFQDYTEDEACVALRCCRLTVVRRFPQALDQLTEVFLRNGILRPLVRPD